jgi:ubiquinol-cytochrome c reductase cytochrome c1 subunit
MRRIIVLVILLSVTAVVYERYLKDDSKHGAHFAEQAWSFNSMLGTYDLAALQRGFQVYKEVCSACHSMNLLAYRNLQQIGFSSAEVKAIAAAYTVADGPNDEGDDFERPGLPKDRFVAPFKNDNAARAANNGSLPPDMSLIAKARIGGPDYIHALLADGYTTPPASVEVLEGLHYNKYFPNNQIAMAAPLTEGHVEYADGTAATVDQMAYDVSNFLMWAADPYMVERKRTGLKVIIFLLILTGLLYGAKKRIWSKLYQK